MTYSAMENRWCNMHLSIRVPVGFLLGQPHLWSILFWVYVDGRVIYLALRIAWRSTSGKILDFKIYLDVNARKSSQRKQFDTAEYIFTMLCNVGAVLHPIAALIIQWSWFASVCNGGTESDLKMTNVSEIEAPFYTNFRNRSIVLH